MITAQLFDNRGSSNDVVTNMQDCNIIVSEFKLQSCYHVYFQTQQKCMNPLSPQVFVK